MVIGRRLNPHLGQRMRGCRALNASRPPTATPDAILTGWALRSHALSGFTRPLSSEPYSVGYGWPPCFLPRGRPLHIQQRTAPISFLEVWLIPSAAGWLPPVCISTRLCAS